MSLSIVEQIKSRLDIVEVISSYIKVEKAGINWKAKCPFHNEKTPSFFISQSRQNFYCFGCHEKGDIISFVEKIEGLDFKEAVKNLADKAGIELKKEAWLKPTENKDRLYEILERATIIFEENIKKREDVKSYLKKRGLNQKTISKWRIGVAKDEWRSLLEELQKNSFSKEDLLRIGLIKKVVGEEKYYDTFRDRIIFPIFDNSNRVIAFSGRTLKKDDKTPKYLNSPESELFYKSDVLYGLNFARDFIRKLNYTILVEGQMDLILSHETGTKNTVATSGTAITLMHLKKIQRLSNRLVVAYDGDSPGKKAGKQACLTALSLGMAVKIVNLEENEDPASIIEKDSKKWTDYIKNAHYYVDFVLNEALSRKTEREMLQSVRNDVLPTIKAIESEIERERYIKKIANSLKIDEKSIIKDLLKIKNDFTELDEKDTFIQEKKFENINLQKLITAIIFKEEENKETKSLRKYEQLVGKKNVQEILDRYRDHKEGIIIEMEIHGIDLDSEKIINEIFNRIELDMAKSESYEIAKKLDTKNLMKKEEEELKNKFILLGNKIKNLSDSI